MGKRIKPNDVAGLKFGRLTIVSFLGIRKRYEKFFLCKCDCGNEIEAYYHNLKIGHTNSCGCLVSETISKLRKASTSEFIGVKFGKLTVISDNGIIGNESHVLCKCDCGAKKSIGIKRLKMGLVKSCGCSKGYFVKLNKTTHGMTGTPLHNVWLSMKERCYNDNANQFMDYGGRGVEVCDEWKNNFMSFYKWAVNNGYSNGKQIDKDKLGNGLLYSPQTCCFLTSKENSRLRRSNNFIYYNGERKCLAEWCEIFGIKYNLTHQRIYRDHWSLDKAFKIFS